MSRPETIVLDGESLTIDAVHSAAVDYARVSLAESARERMRATQKVVADIVERNDVVYGVTTGFGKLSEIAIPPDKLAELQVNLVRSHSAGVGPVLPRREVRAMMLLRANVLAKGYSGARPELVDLLLAMINKRIHPPIREQGSVGASGDLAPLAALGVALIGEGELSVDGSSPKSAAADHLGPERRNHAHQWNAGTYGDSRARCERCKRSLARCTCCWSDVARSVDGNARRFR